MTVFLGETEQLTSADVRGALKGLGQDVRAYEDGDHLVAAVEAATDPSIVISDGELPGLSVQAVARALGRSGGVKSGYFILALNRLTPEALEADINQGADDVLPLPVLPAELRSRVVVAKRLLGPIAASSGSAPQMPADSRYEVRHLLGSGGLGRVYAGWDRVLNRQVAIKFVNEVGWALDGQDGAWREATLTARVHHPNIVTIHDFGWGAEGPFMVMEWLEGWTLTDELEHGAVAPSRVGEIARQVLDGLDAAHAQNVLHCDLKPSNLMIESVPGEDGRTVRVRILDFGLARLKAESDRGQRPIMGTPFYVAPEVLRGEPLDARSDLYSLGHVLYHALAGRPAYDRENPSDVLACHLCGEPVPILRPEKGDGWWGALNAWLGKFMAPRPADRFASARAALEMIPDVWAGSAAETGGRKSWDVPTSALRNDRDRIVKAPSPKPRTERVSAEVRTPGGRTFLSASP